MQDQTDLAPSTYSATELGFSETDVSQNALFVVQQLENAGYDGYLVGGCVRDLVLGLKPKDFDVTTNATPEQVRSIFKRSKIIGRRFKIVHVSFRLQRDQYPSTEIIEVATYRGDASKQPVKTNDSGKQIGRRIRKHKGKKHVVDSMSGRILDDNVYGTLSEDALRRDFTVNALYYDPVNDAVLDYCAGIDDIQSRTLRLIGDPDLRFAEDPVRMLRAIRFCAKLKLRTEAGLGDEIDSNAERLIRVPPARLYDEVLKLFHHGSAMDTWQALLESPIGSLLFSQTVASFGLDEDQTFARLIEIAMENTDSRINAGLPVMAGYLYAVLLWKPFLLEIKKQHQLGLPKNEVRWAAADQVFKIQNQVISIPWRVRSPASEIWELQPLLERRSPRSIRRILDNRRFRAAYDFLEMRSKVGELDASLVNWWTTIQGCDSEGVENMISERRTELSGKPSENPARSRKRKRSRSRRNKPSKD